MEETGMASPPGIEPEEQELLKKLDTLEAATVFDLAFELRRLPDEVEEELARLSQAGLLEVRSRSAYKVYLLSARGKRLFHERERRRLPEP